MVQLENPMLLLSRLFAVKLTTEAKQMKWLSRSMMGVAIIYRLYSCNQVCISRLQLTACRSEMQPQVKKAKGAEKLGDCRAQWLIHLLTMQYYMELVN